MWTVFGREWLGTKEAQGDRCDTQAGGHFSGGGTCGWDGAPAWRMEEKGGAPGSQGGQSVRVWPRQESPLLWEGLGPWLEDGGDRGAPGEPGGAACESQAQRQALFLGPLSCVTQPGPQPRLEDTGERTHPVPWPLP